MPEPSDPISNLDDEIVDAEIIDEEQDLLDEITDALIDDSEEDEEYDPDDPAAIRPSTQKKIQALSLEERKRAALQLRLSGSTYAQIGKALGVDSTVAGRYVRALMNETRTEGVESLRRIQYMRLEHMLMLTWPGVQERSSASMNTALSIMDRQTRLMGLDSPMKVDMEVGSGTMINVEGDKEAFIDTLVKARAALTTGQKMDEDDEPLFHEVPDIVDPRTTKEEDSKEVLPEQPMPSPIILNGNGNNGKH